MNAFSAANFLRTETKGKLFGVTFRKRSDGTLRRMVARFGVHKGTTGAGPRFDANSRGLLTVAEFVDGAYQYRSIPIEGIEEIRFQGETLKVGH